MFNQEIANYPEAVATDTSVLRPEAHAVLLKQMCAYIKSIGGTDD